MNFHFHGRYTSLILNSNASALFRFPNCLLELSKTYTRQTFGLCLFHFLQFLKIKSSSAEFLRYVVFKVQSLIFKAFFRAASLSDRIIYYYTYHSIVNLYFPFFSVFLCIPKMMYKTSPIRLYRAKKTYTPAAPKLSSITPPANWHTIALKLELNA